MNSLKKASFILVALLGLGALKGTTNAQSVSANPVIAFGSFTANYYLSRDAGGHSLLTSDEVILADFPSSGNYTGITRAIPKNYQRHSVTVKVLSVKDAGGDIIPYKTSSDKSGNLVITTGNPSITLYGSQTFRIDYQTRDVVDTNNPTDQLLLDVNGRGWQQPFTIVTGILHVPKSFSSTIIGEPGCYIGYQSITTKDCTITSKDNGTETLITAKSDGQVAAAHTLVIKTAFKPATFTKPSKSSALPWIIIASAVVLAALISIYWLAKRK